MALTVTELETDVLVIGGGLTALRAAIAAAEAGARVTVAAKGVIARSGSTPISSAGVAGCIADATSEDSVETYLADIRTSGRAINHPRLSEVLALESGPALIDLQRFGISFVSGDNGWDRVRVPGHTHPRSFRAAPFEGHGNGLGLTLPLRRCAEELGVVLLDACPVIDIVTSGKRLAGAIAADLNLGQLRRIRCAAAILATGGLAYMYARTNGTRDVTGDGLALALRAGASLRDMEFVQFHPTRMVRPVSMLLSDGLIADGAVLRDRHGREFMHDYHPRGNHAPRDVRAWAVFQEIRKGNGVDGGVLLDCAAVPMERLKLRHAALLRVMETRGWGFPGTPVVASPAAHFLMGGVSVDEHGRTEVAGLYAAGEAAGGAHGANRLGSMGLSEAVVMGIRAGAAAAGFARGAGKGPSPDAGRWLDQLEPGAPPCDTVLSRSWQRLRKTMWEHVSLSRSEEGLRSALMDVEALRCELAPIRAGNLRDLARLTDLRLALETAAAVVLSALLRCESRGAHRREDHPDESPEWLGNVYVRMLQSGRLETSFIRLDGSLGPALATG